MPNFKAVKIDSTVAMNTPRREYFRKQGVSAYACLIPQTHEVAHEVHFVSDEDGTEYGQFEDEQRALARAGTAVRSKRPEPSTDMSMG